MAKRNRDVVKVECPKCHIKWWTNIEFQKCTGANCTQIVGKDKHAVPSFIKS